MGRRLFQSERNADLLIDVLRSCVSERTFQLHDFVVMPDHVHLLITVDDGTAIEKAMQLVKGRFSFRLRRELGYLGEVWQRGFSDVRVRDQASFVAHRRYIAQNPVKERLVNAPEVFPYCYEYLVSQKRQGLKPSS